MEVRIQKGIPPPAPRKSKKLPWKQMEAGDSFLFRGSKAEIRSVRSQAHAYGKSLGCQFVVRRAPGEDQGDAQAVRVWRVLK